MSAAKTKRKHKRVSVGYILVDVILVLALLFWLFPLFMALLNSFKTDGELFTNVLAFPQHPTFDNYVRAFEKMQYGRSLLNTIFLAALGVGLIVLFSSVAGWALCRTKTRFSNILLKFFIFSMLIPFSAIMIPLYKVVTTFHMRNSLVGLGFIYAGLGVSMAIFLYHGFVKGVPYEIEEAALVDGCNKLQVFFRVVFPLLKPITATVVITNALWIWNDFLLPLIVLSNRKVYTLLLSTNTLFGQYSNDWTGILSALILSALPVIIFYLFFQKKILAGLTNGALKG